CDILLKLIPPAQVSHLYLLSINHKLPYAKLAVFGGVIEGGKIHPDFLTGLLFITFSYFGLTSLP
ncbi:MAG: hypothetical protein KAQ79_23225, partial [Cyclobacteriaceae bacterium]|nr:hypothetical protein [Cyclobacteriaceae bacterium]